MLGKFVQGLKDLVIEDDGKQAPPVQVSRSLPLGTLQQQDSGTAAFVDALRTVLKSRATAFTALLGAADKLSTVIPDPNMRLKAAYEMVKADGRGLNELLGAVEIHANDLAQQERQFSLAAEQALSAAVGTMERELNALAPSTDAARSQIESLQQQIANLNATIANNSARQTELTGKIAEEHAHFESSKVQFNTALTTVRAELLSQKTVISSTLS